jgi:hypothetical protein
MKKNLAWFFFWILAAAASSGAYLFQVPGFHYDEAWIAQLASQIAFQPSFWPVFGMNHYTIPVMSYLLAAVFRLFGHPSLELARGFYFGVNLLSFALFYLWIFRGVGRGIGRRNAKAAWIFALLWVTLPLSVFNQRIFLEVTTGYAIFAAVALWGLSEGILKNKTSSLSWFVLGLISIALGAASHILFLGCVWAALWACWKECPEMFENPRVKWAVTITLAPMILLLAVVMAAPIGGGERAKAAIVAAVTLITLIAVWKQWWKSSMSKKLLQISGWILTLVSIAGLFFFFLFEISGVWPISQTTGNVNELALIPGFGVAAILLYAVFNREIHRDLQKTGWPKSFLFFRTLWLATSALTVISIYKPTSARYWELSMLTFLIVGAWALSELKKHQKLLVSGLVVASLLNVAVLAKSYFAETLLHGATAESYHWLWVHDSSLDYRPVVRAYQLLETSKEVCDEDFVDVDQGRNLYVLQVYRRFERMGQYGRPCEAGHIPERHTFLTGDAQSPGLGDVKISQGE